MSLSIQILEQGAFNFLIESYVSEVQLTYPARTGRGRGNVKEVEDVEEDLEMEVVVRSQPLGLGTSKEGPSTMTFDLL